MKDLSRLHIILSPEQFKAIQPVLQEREIILESFKLMKKDYAAVKNKIKSIEKKLAVLMQQAGDNSFTCKWIEHEVEHIEKKYPVIEHAIMHYKRAISAFHHILDGPRLYSFNPSETYGSYITNLRNYLSSAESYIDRAQDAIRITERYFKNISFAFKAHASLMAARKRAGVAAAGEDTLLFSDSPP